MAKYTMELRECINLLSREEVESWFMQYNLYDYLTQEEINKIVESNIWSKERLAKKIVNHYFMREIGFETIGLFKHYVKTAMDEIMESKLPLIYTNSLKYDPLVNVDYFEDFTRNINQENITKSNSTSNSESSGSGLTINSDTPQGNVNKNDILSGKYASSTNSSETLGNISDNSENKSEGNNITKEIYSKHFKGNQGISASYQAMIKQYRENIVAIDKDIINELNNLFMGLF